MEMDMSEHNNGAQPAPRLTIDWDAYLPFFEDEDIPEAQKREMIETLWSIVIAFVDLGFEQRGISCGQEDEFGQDIRADVVSYLEDAGLVEMKRGILEARLDQARP